MNGNSLVWKWIAGVLATLLTALAIWALSQVQAMASEQAVLMNRVTRNESDLRDINDQLDRIESKLNEALRQRGWEPSQ